MKHFKNISQLATLTKVGEKKGRNLLPEDLAIIDNASIVFNEDEILWVGKSSELPSKYAEIDAIDLTNKIVIPEIVDSHTHLVFAGDRSKEYSMRLNGKSYEEIANAGGGILNTVGPTQASSFDELFKSGKKRIEKIHSYGIGTIEIKSGYGLTRESEKLTSEVIHKLKEHFCGEVQIINTYMAAHAIPKNFSNSADYINQVVGPLFKDLASRDIIDFVDIFHEQNYFTDQDVNTLFKLADDLGIKKRIHADELNDNNGAKLAINNHCSSADHLLCISDKNIELLASSNTVATLLPGTALFLGKKLPPARKLLDAGCQVAMASDYNPGSCNIDNLLQIAAISGKNLGMNICELFAAITYNGAAALSLENQGVIAKGYKPRLTVFDCKKIDDVFYHWGNIKTLVT